MMKWKSPFHVESIASKTDYRLCQRKLKVYHIHLLKEFLIVSRANRVTGHGQQESKSGQLLRQSVLLLGQLLRPSVLLLLKAKNPPKTMCRRGRPSRFVIWPGPGVPQGCQVRSKVDN